MIISNTHKFIFIHIHKTGGESVAAALTPDLDDNDWIPSPNPRAWLRTHSRQQFRTFRPLGKHSPACLIKSVVPESIWDSYFKFAFVRHPVDRVTSLYHFTSRMVGERESWSFRQRWWHLTPAGGRGDPRKWAAGRAFLETNSFSEFIRHPLVRDDPGMKPQSSFVYDDQGQLMIDFVGRFEQLDQDLGTILRNIGLPPRDVPWKNASNAEASREVASKDDCAFLQTIFREDFDRFRYELA